MQKRRLGQRWERLVYTLDHHIGPAVHGTDWKAGMEPEMCSVCLIHNQGNMKTVRCPGNSSHIGYHPVIGGLCDNYRFDPRIFPQRLLHLPRRDPAVQSILRFLLRIQINRVQLL